MHIGPELIAFLAEFYTAAEIRGFWKTAGDAMMSTTATLIHINSTSYEGQSSAGITLANTAERLAFMGACRSAIAQIEGTSGVPIESIATSVDFSRRAVGT